MFLISVLSSIASGIISGIIASVLLNKYYWSQKPNLIISDYIAKNDRGEYRVKIVNKSKFYVTNVFIQVQLVTITNGDGGNILNVINIDIPYKTIQIINPYNKKDIDAPYAVRLVISKDLEQIWKDDSHTYLKMMIYCSNEHNNSSKLYEKKYHKKNKIKHGNFKFGTLCEIE